MYKAIGKRIKQLRIKQKLTQMQLAEKAEISLSFLGHIERGTRKMSLETFVNITKALDCSADELLMNSKHWEMKLSTILEILLDKYK